MTHPIEANETVVVFKTSASSMQRLVEAILRTHPYELPYIAWGRGEAVTHAYEEWVTTQTSDRRAPRRARARPSARRKT